MKTLSIKHKLWGKLKKKAHDTYKIIPVKDSELYSIKNEKCDWSSSNYTLEEAIDCIEHCRTLEFKKLCHQVLYERRKKKVKNL